MDDINKMVPQILTETLQERGLNMVYHPLHGWMVFPQNMTYLMDSQVHGAMIDKLSAIDKRIKEIEVRLYGENGTTEPESETT